VKYLLLSAAGYRYDTAHTVSIFRPQEQVAFDITPAQHSYPRLTSDQLRQDAVAFDASQHKPAFPILTIMAVPSGWFEVTVPAAEHRTVPAGAFVLLTGLTEDPVDGQSDSVPSAARTQATARPSSSVVSGGSIARHLTSANAQRGAKRHPSGTAVAFGTSPRSP